METVAFIRISLATLVIALSEWFVSIAAKILGANYCVQLKNSLTAKEIRLSRETLALHAEMYHGVPIL